MVETKPDKSIERSRQRAEFRKGVIGFGTESEVKKVRERGRVRRSVERTKAQTKILERQESERARVETARQRAAISVDAQRQRNAQRIQTQQDLKNLQSRRTVVTDTGKAVRQTSAWETLMMLTALFFAMILIYVLVTNGQAFGNLAGTIGTWIQGVSSNKPLYVKS